MGCGELAPQRRVDATMSDMYKPWVGFLTVVAALLCVYFCAAAMMVGHDASYPAERVLATALYITSGAAALVACCALMYGGDSTERLDEVASSGGTTDRVT